MMKKVVILGSGRMSGPVIEYLAVKYQVTVATNVLEEAERLIENKPNTEAVFMNVDNDDDEMEKLLRGSHLVISLLPLSYHEKVARICIRVQTNMITASYTSPQIRQLHQQAVEAGVLILNEMGLDPGIDHMLTRQCVDRARAQGSQVVKFTSHCGGIPASDVITRGNPLKYKFSWNPVTALTACLLPARFRLDGELIEVPAGGHVLDHVTNLEILAGASMECFPNGDAVRYQELFGLQSAETFIRGSIRYQGFASTMWALVKLGLVDTAPRPSLLPHAPEITWRELICELVKMEKNTDLESLKSAILQLLNGEEYKLKAVQELGLLDENSVNKLTSPVATLADHLEKRYPYVCGERDMVILRNLAEIQFESQTDTQTYEELMVVYGDSEHSAMAKTVGYCVAIGAEMILEGELSCSGVRIPDNEDFYLPVLQRLKTLGIESVQLR